MHGKATRRHDLQADAAGLAVHLAIEGCGAFSHQIPWKLARI
jgi:hypothetical protein